MPQIEKTTFFIQYVYLTIILLMFYISLEQLILPNLFQVFKTRLFLYKELKKNFIIANKNYQKLHIIKNKYNQFILKLNLINFSQFFNKLFNNNLSTISKIKINNITQLYLYKKLFKPYKFIELILEKIFISNIFFLNNIQINQKLLKYVFSVFTIYKNLIKK